MANVLGTKLKTLQERDVFLTTELHLQSQIRDIFKGQ